MFDLKTIAVLGCSVFALASCGGNGGGEVVSGDNLYSAISSGSVARALDDGKTLAAKHNAVTQIDWNAGETSASSGNFSVRKTDEGHLAFTVDGTEHIFTAADIDDDYSYAIEDDGNMYWVYLSSYDGELVEDLDPSDGGYVQVYSWYVDVDGDGIAYRGASVTGTETNVAQLDLLTSATYRGWMNVDFSPDTGYSGSNSQVRVRGDMGLNADFNAGTISGSSEAGQLRLRDMGADEVFMDGVLTYEAGVINGTTYGGDVSVDADFMAATGVGDVTGTYEGSFYGPFADEVAGTLVGTTDGGYNFIGQFNADWQN